MALIEMEKVTKDYHLGETVVHALRGIDLEIDRKEFVAIWGPSGSGKTTLLNLIGAIDEPTGGSLSIDGTPVRDLSDNKRSELRGESIGFIFQSFNLVPVLTALENVMLPLQIKGASTRSPARSPWTGFPRSASRNSSTTAPSRCRAASSRGSPLPGPW